MNDLSQQPLYGETSPVQTRQGRQFSGEADAAFVLHTYAYRETSLIVETFTRQHAASLWSRRVPNDRMARYEAC